MDYPGFTGLSVGSLGKDWRTWEGTCWGYEGFLSDNYYALLAVMDREAAIKRDGKPVSNGGP